jgi:hypothetical protein
MAAVQTQLFTSQVVNTAGNGRGLAVGFSVESTEYAYGEMLRNAPTVGTNVFEQVPSITSIAAAAIAAYTTRYRQFLSLIAQSKSFRGGQQMKEGMILSAIRLSSSELNFNGVIAQKVSNSPKAATFTAEPLDITANVTPDQFQNAVVNIPLNVYINDNLAFWFFFGTASLLTVESLTISFMVAQPYAVPVERL